MYTTGRADVHIVQGELMYRRADVQGELLCMRADTYIGELMCRIADV